MDAAQKNDRFLVQVLTPERLVCEQHVKMAIIPGQAGEFGVLSHHSFFASTMKEGTVSLVQDDIEQAQRFHLTGGVINVTPEKCVILADTCTAITEAC